MVKYKGEDSIAVKNVNNIIKNFAETPVIKNLLKSRSEENTKQSLILLANKIFSLGRDETRAFSDNVANWAVNKNTLPRYKYIDYPDKKKLQIGGKRNKTKKIKKKLFKKSLKNKKNKK